MINLIKGFAFTGFVLCGVGAAAAADLNVALIYGRSGPLEAYAKQTENGLRLGFEYATKGSMEIDGRKINIILKDDQSKPEPEDRGSQKADLDVGNLIGDSERLQDVRGAIDLRLRPRQSSALRDAIVAGLTEVEDAADDA